MSANPTQDIRQQAFAEFDSKIDDIAERIIKRGESLTDIARSLQWPVRMLQSWWKINRDLQGKK